MEILRERLARATAHLSDATALLTPTTTAADLAALRARLSFAQDDLEMALARVTALLAAPLDPDGHERAAHPDWFAP